jgi:3-methyladenine DNA glycosylase AlkD
MRKTAPSQPPTKEEINQIAEKVVSLTSAGNTEAAFCMLKQILDRKCPFAKLDSVGRKIGQSGVGQPQFFEIFDKIIDYNAMGGFVIVGRALIYFLPENFGEVMEKSSEYIIKGDKWYVCDIIGERSLGQALVDYFDETLPWLEKFLKDSNKWVKRSVGVALHFFSKRVLDEPEKTEKLLDLIEPHMEEKQIDFVKGIGWGLKTIGRHHPDLLVQFLKRQIDLKKNVSKLMMRKAVTYLEEEKKAEIHRRQ